MKKVIYKPFNNNMNMEVISRIIAIFRNINERNIDLALYDDRLNLQKLTYIIQSAKLNFGYRFTWYVRGPYSPPLATDAFEYMEKGIEENMTLTREEHAIVEKLKHEFSHELKDTSKLELYASLLFLKDDRISLSDEETLANKLTSLKPWFTKEQAIQATRKLRNTGIF
jgi:uncharacterized protein YwgA